MRFELYLLLALGLIAFLMLQTNLSERRRKEEIRKKIRLDWGKRPEREYSYEEFDRIPHYFKQMKNGEFVIDDITWNDLDMDTIFMLLNTTKSSVGEEYLYKILRTPLNNKELLVNRNRLADYFLQNEEDVFRIEEIYASIGRTKKISLYDYIYRLTDLGIRKNWKHYLLDMLFGASIASLFIKPEFGIVFLVVMIATNIIQYYKAKAEVESYFTCFQYLVGMLVNAENICSLKIAELSEYTDELKNICRKLSPLKRGVFLLTSNQMSGSLGDMIMDYVRMLTHVDMIKFNSMHRITINHLDTIDRLYEILGIIESTIAIASYRKMMPYYTVPQLVDRKELSLNAVDLYHPMIEQPVENSIHVNRGALITGSNASGKSTFLKTVAINAILAQTIYTCTARKYQANFFDIFSSMALRDDLEGHDSYYIVEIKSLKRIMDHMKTDRPILCFIDEVLRGTNTVERIAASSRIMKSLAANNVLCFAATHDIELTHILEKHYENFHFQEEILENDIRFPYKLYDGRAVSRNAIKLLNIIGFDSGIIREAENSANNFIMNGIWETIE